MNSNFEQSLSLTLKEEGGYSNDPHDPGGATNFGVIQREYNSYRRLRNEAPRSVKQIEPREYQEIYRTLYWDKVWADKLPSGLDYAVFDYAVNSGPHQAILDLQRTVNKVGNRNIDEDGNIGSATLDAITDSEDVSALISAYWAKRLSFLQRLKTWSFFGKGWTGRCKRGKASSLGMVDTSAPRQEKPEVPNLGDAADRPKDNSGNIPAFSITAIIGSAAAGLAQAVNNPYALVGLLVVLSIGGLMAYKKWG